MYGKAPISLILLSFAFLSFAEGSEGGLISGPDWGILVSAPKGWVRDTQAFRPRGVEGLFRKEGERFSPSGLYISISPREKRAGGPSSLPKFIEEEKASIASSDPELAFRELPAYSPGMEYRFSMLELDAPGKDNYRTLAFYEGGRAFFSFVLSCGSPQEREAERGALFELLDSFVYLSKE
jgi:hypothetical protein